MKRIRHIVGIGMGMLLGVVIGVPGIASTASAATTTSSPQVCTAKDPIAAGLWTGFNLATGSTGCGTASTTTTTSTSNSASSTGGKYVALGDSVAAGLGVPSAMTGTDVACGVSTHAYPALVAASLGRSYRNVACSGATVGDLFTEQHLSGTSRDIEPQLDQAFANGTPGLITLTAGANDIYWSRFLQACYVRTCGTASDQSLASALMYAMRDKLAYALSSIQHRSGGNPPTVIVTGYYQPLAYSCAGQSGLTNDELTWLRNQIVNLNQALRVTVDNYASSFVRFASVGFSGHELCTSDSWVQGPNDAAPFHPTARGQQAIAQAVLAVIK